LIKFSHIMCERPVKFYISHYIYELLPFDDKQHG